MQNVRYVALGFSQIAVGTATGLGTLPAGATVAIIQIDTANVRWTDIADTPPTTTLGMQLKSTDPAYEYWGDLSHFKMTAVSGSPVANVSFYRIAG